MFFKSVGKQIFLLGFNLFVCFSLSAQEAFVFEGKRSQELLGFKKSRGLVILPMYINGKGPFNFILDTGVGSVIITDAKLKDSLNLQHLRKIAIDGLGENDKLIGFSTPFLTLKVGSAVYKSASAVILESDNFDLSGYFGMPIHGLLGYDFFKSFIVKLNYEAGVLKVFSKKKARLFKNGTRIPMLIVDKKPFIDALVVTDQGKKLNLKLLVDCGSGHPLSLQSFENKPFELPHNFVLANLGVGLNGNIKGVDGRVSKLSIGKFTFDNMLTSFPHFKDVGAKLNPNTSNGSIGNPLLSRFSVVFDYQNQHLFLKPLNRINRPFDYDKSGLELVCVGDNFDRYLINRVVPGSAADEFGLMSGDELLAINFTKVAALTYSEIVKMLSSEPGRTLFIEVARGDEVIMGVLKLKQRI
ncbi:MAG TPA: aspartyl protease family protein [Pelobium sp.]